MHAIEPYYGWIGEYCSTHDSHSPFYGKEYNEFTFSNKIYNYFIHPQWDYFGSETMYAKVIYADYTETFAVIELIGEWNDCLHNDIMTFKNEVINNLLENHINKFVICCDHVLNFHASDDCYYEEWFEDIAEGRGWITLLNLRDHVIDEMNSSGLQTYLNYGSDLNDINWRKLTATGLIARIETVIQSKTRGIH